MKKKEEKLTYPKRPKRLELTREETLKRMEDFPKRAPKIAAAIRGVKEAEVLEETEAGTEKLDKKKPQKFRADRVKLTAEESLQRLKDLPKRREKIIAAIRKGKDRSVSA